VRKPNAQSIWKRSTWRGALACLSFAPALLVHAPSHRVALPPHAERRAAAIAERGPRESFPLDRPAYRLGDAAKPFGWSTAIADFNADHEPDFAVADRTARWGGDYGYHIELSISGMEPDVLALQTDQGAVTVDAIDVDHDNDVDIVASAVLSHEVVGVWLNDGHGRFASADVNAFPVAVQPSEKFNTGYPAADSDTSSLPPRREAHGLPRAFVLSLPVSRSRLIISRSNPSRSAFRASASGPRAPPTVLAAC
jgi:hypothetical protein